MSESSTIIYPRADGKTSIQLRVQAGSVGLTQMEIAELFQTTKQNVSLHVKNVSLEQELVESATVQESLTDQPSVLKGRPFISEGQRPGNKDTDMMISPERA